MTTPVPYTDNYTDHSTESGYQFEFFCERCGNGYKSGFQKSALGIGAGVLRGVSGLLGGRFGGAETATDRLRDMTESQAKDKALREAVEECRPLFNQCHKCGQWVCKEICWNDEAQLCVTCAPKLEQELAGMQQQRLLQQVSERVAEADYDDHVNVERRQVALCPHCGAEAQHSAKFCGECGGSLSTDVTCEKCGTTAPAGTKFCPECGTKHA